MTHHPTMTTVRRCFGCNAQGFESRCAGRHNRIHQGSAVPHATLRVFPILDVLPPKHERPRAFPHAGGTTGFHEVVPAGASHSAAPRWVWVALSAGVTPFKFSSIVTFADDMRVQILDDWDFDHLISAHNGGCYGVGKETARALLAESEPLLRELSERNARTAAAGEAGLAGQVRFQPAFGRCVSQPVTRGPCVPPLLAHFWLTFGSLLCQEHKPSKPMGWSETECECG